MLVVHASRQLRLVGPRCLAVDRAGTAGPAGSKVINEVRATGVTRGSERPPTHAHRAYG